MQPLANRQVGGWPLFCKQAGRQAGTDWQALALKKAGAGWQAGR
jgi:hypothetical protein